MLKFIQYLADLAEKSKNPSFQDVEAMGNLLEERIKQFGDLIAKPITQRTKDDVKLEEKLLSDISSCVRCGAKLNQPNASGRFPMHLAADCNSTDILELFLRHGASVHVKDAQDETPLHYAVFKGNFEATSFLIKHGADTNAVSVCGQTPLMKAAYTRFAHTIAIVLKLLLEKADPNITRKDGRTALMIAAEAGSSDIVKELLERGAKVNAKDANGWTAAMWASARRFDTTLFPLLESYGADLTLRDQTGRHAGDIKETDPKLTKRLAGLLMGELSLIHI